MTTSAESLKLGHAIQPVVFGEALLMLETMVFPSAPLHTLLCAAVIGTDVPLASHRATFPLIATLYADGLHLPRQLSPLSVSTHLTLDPPLALSVFLFLSITLLTTVRWPAPLPLNFRRYFYGA